MLQSRSEAPLSVRDGNRAPVTGPTDLVGLLEATAARWPDRPALSCRTYRQLLREAWGLSAQLAQAAVRPGDRVGLLTHPSAAAARALLAVLGCGAAYVPLNPDFPDERLARIAAEAGLARVLAPDADRARAEALGAPVGALDPADLAPCDAPIARPAPGDLAYVMFTSGSTGRPKGVPIRHASVVNAMACFREWLEIGPQDRWLAVAALSFDISVFEHFLPWSAGAELAHATRAEVRDGARLSDAIARERPTALCATPAGWRLLLEAGWEGRPDLLAMTGGEALTPALAGALLPRCRALWNLYGPTETTIWSTAARVHDAGPVALGEPVHHTGLYVLDPDTLAPVACGTSGELAIGGAGLSPGYLGRPDLTAERFVPNPMPGTPDPVVYRTGDRVRMHADGALEYLGRLDFQVKLRGHRIELGEIESALFAHPGVRQAAVVLRDDLPEPALVAYLAGDAVPDRTLRAYLRARLPEVMIPAHIEWVTGFTLNSNGKIDRKALPRPRAIVTPVVCGPADPVLAAASAVLGCVVGDADDLFEAGLDSLGAGRLARRLEPIFGHPVSVDLVFQARTPARLRELAPQRAAEPLVVDLEPGPDGAPLVIVHTLTGSLPRDLARALAAHRPVLGLRCPREDERPCARLEEVAARAVEELAARLPEGPLHLVGFSYGGVLALEVARQWGLLGRTRGLLTVLDTDVRHLVRARPRRVLEAAAGLAGTLAAHTRDLWPVAVTRTATWRKLLRCRALAPGHPGLATLGDEEIAPILEAIPGFRELPEVNQRGARRNLRLEASYRVRPVDAPVLLLRRRHAKLLEARDLGWRSVTSALTIEELATDSHELLNDANYRVIADRIATALGKS